MYNSAKILQLLGSSSAHQVVQEAKTLAPNLVIPNQDPQSIQDNRRKADGSQTIESCGIRLHEICVNMFGSQDAVQVSPYFIQPLLTEILHCRYGCYMAQDTKYLQLNEVDSKEFCPRCTCVTPFPAPQDIQSGFSQDSQVPPADTKPPSQINPTSQALTDWETQHYEAQHCIDAKDVGVLHVNSSKPTKKKKRAFNKPATEASLVAPQAVTPEKPSKQQSPLEQPNTDKFRVTVQNTTSGDPVILSISFEDYQSYICPLLNKNLSIG